MYLDGRSNDAFSQLGCLFKQRMHSFLNRSEQRKQSSWNSSTLSPFPPVKSSGSFVLEGEDGLPIVLHTDDCPAILLRLLVKRRVFRNGRWVRSFLPSDHLKLVSSLYSVGSRLPHRYLAAVPAMSL